MKVAVLIIGEIQAAPESERVGKRFPGHVTRMARLKSDDR
jgi:hypothetical protein